jgi:nucleoside-diphosphate-sugar epimerase
MSNSSDAILVTGGSGFLGTEVCRQLIAAGQKVIDVRHKANPSSDVISMTADISDRKQLETIFLAHKISAIIHMAATLTTNSNQNPDLAFQVNVLGSNNLLELSHQYGVKRFIYSSSYSALGYTPIEKCPVDESLAPTPDNFYGETKQFVEALGISYARKFGFQFTAGRMGAVVGPGNALSTSSWRMDIFNMLKTGGKIETKFAPQVTLAISLLEDTSRALVTLALASKNQHSIYNLPNDSLSLQQIAQMVKTLRSDIEFSFGTNTDQDMPPLISAERFLQEFSKFRHVPLADALRLFQLS